MFVPTDLADWAGKHWVDALSICTGFGYVLYMRSRMAEPHNRISKATGLDFFNGLALAPLGLLFLGAFSETILDAVVHASGIILAGASILALFAILEEPPIS